MQLYFRHGPSHITLRIKCIIHHDFPREQRGAHLNPTTMLPQNYTCLVVKLSLLVHMTIPQNICTIIVKTSSTSCKPTNNNLGLILIHV